MAVQVLADVDKGASFLSETSEITSFYVDLCFQERKSQPGDDRTARSPAPGRHSMPVTDSETSGGPPPVVSPAYTIAQKLKEMGDKMDEKVTRELQLALMKELKLRHSIIQLGHEQFSGMCRRVLSACSDYLHTGWEQAAVVFMGVFQVAAALRSESENVGQRAAMITGFTGEALQDLRLDTWIDSHGGMSEFGSVVEGESARVPIESSV